MGGIMGGVHPAEWLFAPAAAIHMAWDKGARAAGEKLPPAPDSPEHKEQQVVAQQEKAQEKLQEEAEAARTQAAADLEARTETPQKMLAMRRRAKETSQRLGAGTRRASQTLTDPGGTLSGGF